MIGDIFRCKKMGTFIFIISARIWEKLICRLNRSGWILPAYFYGFWLGVLTKEALYRAGNFSYSRSSIYCGDAHNKSGLFDWEEKALKNYFHGCKSVLVAGAGGGREVFALRNKGYEAEGFECNLTLVARANKLLEAEGFSPDIVYSPPDRCPDSGKVYGGLIVGWGAYMHILGADSRISFLKEMRKHVKEGSPILVSFWTRANAAPAFLNAVAAAANAVRKIIKRVPVEYGDNLGLRGYVHFFTEKEIAEELRLGGFDLLSYSTEKHAHAVGGAAS